MTEDLAQTLESEAGFRVLFQYATVGIVVVGKDGRILVINPNAEQLFGYRNEELLGQKVELLIPQDRRRAHAHHRDDYFTSPKARPMGLGLELYAAKKDGTVFPVEISLGHYQLEGEQMAVAFITDITRRKTAEKELLKANEELESRVAQRTLELTHALQSQTELNEMKSRFVSMASHEFRTPLTSILSSLSLLKEYIGNGQTEKQNKHLERIAGSVKTMTGILNDFLSIDKLEQGKIEIEKTELNIPGLIETIKDESVSLLKSGQAIINQHVGPATVVTDKKVLRTILINLVTNAIKYSDINKDIVVRTSVRENQLEILVRDQGMGIPADEQDHLFSKFFRAKNVNNIQGTGLGLTIVKLYVELLKGTISFRSANGEGTTFTIVFPI